MKNHLKDLAKLLLLIVAILATAAAVSKDWREFFSLMFQVREYRGSETNKSIREMTLQNSVSPDSSREHPKIWALRVPARFVKTEWGSSNADYYSVNLLMDMQLDTGDLRANPRGFTKDAGRMVYRVNLRNSWAPYLRKDSTGRKPDHCYDRQDIAEKFDSPAPSDPLPAVRQCSSEFCEFLMAYHGWDVRFWVSRAEYINKTRYCEFTHDLLDQWTTKIDDLR